MSGHLPSAGRGVLQTRSKEPALRQSLSQAWIEESNVVHRMYREALREFGGTDPAYLDLEAMQHANRQQSLRLQRVLARLSEGFYGPEP